MYTDDNNNSDSNVETVLAVMNGWSPKFCEDFPIFMVLLNYGSADRGTYGTYFLN